MTVLFVSCAMLLARWLWPPATLDDKVTFVALAFVALLHAGAIDRVWRSLSRD